MIAGTTSLPLAVLTLALMTAGCGGGGSSANGSALSKAEFLKKGNAACQRERKGALERIGAYMEAHNSAGKSPAEVNAGMVKAVMLPTIRAETKDLEALAAPAADEKRVEGFLAAQRSAIEGASHLREVGAIQVFEEHFNKASDQMRAYGLGSCANSAKPVDRRLPGWREAVGR